MSVWWDAETWVTGVVMKCVGSRQCFVRCRWCRGTCVLIFHYHNGCIQWIFCKNTCAKFHFWKVWSGSKEGISIYFSWPWIRWKDRGLSPPNYYLNGFDRIIFSIWIRHRFVPLQLRSPNFPLNQTIQRGTHCHPYYNIHLNVRLRNSLYTVHRKLLEMTDKHIYLIFTQGSTISLISRYNNWFTLFITNLFPYSDWSPYFYAESTRSDN